jgi:hypothetical protein
MTKSETIKEIASAVSKFQSEIKTVKAETENPFFKKKYADLSSIWDEIRQPLSRNGLALIQSASASGNQVTITSLLTHVSGEWIQSELTMQAKDTSPQAIGSVITYGRRYELSAMCGTASEIDDDGNAAQPDKKQNALPEPIKKPIPVKSPIPEVKTLPQPGKMPESQPIDTTKKPESPKQWKLSPKQEAINLNKLEETMKVIAISANGFKHYEALAHGTMPDEYEKLIKEFIKGFIVNQINKGVYNDPSVIQFNIDMTKYMDYSFLEIISVVQLLENTFNSKVPEPAKMPETMEAPNFNNDFGGN